MFAFTDSERDYLAPLGAIVKDAQGREVLVGLTTEETEFYMGYLRRRAAGEILAPEGDDERYDELHHKHEMARFAVLDAENYRRVNKPPEH